LALLGHSGPPFSKGNQEVRLIQKKSKKTACHMTDYQSKRYHLGCTKTNPFNYSHTSSAATLVARNSQSKPSCPD
tara:strand:- start:648 stop:872 length:225 start_codon:yes stop_codon:yes gene_type:complete